MFGGGGGGEAALECRISTAAVLECRIPIFVFRSRAQRPAALYVFFWRRRAPVLECRISTAVLPSAWLVWLVAGCFVQTRSALTQPHKNEHRMVLKPLCEGGGGYLFFPGARIAVV